VSALFCHVYRRCDLTKNTKTGSVVRKQTEEKFAEEIDAVYKESGDRWMESTSRYGSITQAVEIKVEFSSKDSP
jgi:hypothetical protein